jgi:hypothetical protein
MSEEESTGVGLIQNLGTSPIDMATGHIDDDLFSVLTPQEFIFSLWLRHKVGPESPEGKHMYLSKVEAASMLSEAKP